MWQPFLLLALAAAAWRWLRRRRAGRPRILGSLPDVGDAPPDAEPLVRPRFDDTGLATYSTVLPASRMRAATTVRARQGPPRRRARGSEPAEDRPPPLR